MKVLIDITHPAHVHLFKNFIAKMEDKGHILKVTARDKELTKYLLRKYDIEYELINNKIKLGIVGEWAYRDYKMLIIARKFNPDYLIGVLNPTIAHIGKLLRKKSVILTDTEHARIGNIATIPFTNIILTPSCYLRNLGRKQVRYNSFHELAYLHPNHFKPDSRTLDELGLSEKYKIGIVRFVSWNATHDKRQYGIRDKIHFIKELEAYCNVLITSESPLSGELEKFRIQLPPERIHDLLFFASIYIGEGATMATEAAILGTPSIYISSLCGTMGNFINLEKNYRLLFSCNDTEKALSKAIELLKDTSIKEDWRSRREILMKEKIDFSNYLIYFIENS
ncbi:MAG: DUF354 domain-containing protein [Methanotrichaceae archaeon]|nr:DUF354 domain-containing protein [Methanotrichaceae archaeon]